MTNKEMVNQCEYCTQAVPLVIGNSDDKGICLIYPNYLSAYGYDIHGSDSNGLCVKINYCPMCGRELKVKQMMNEEIKKLPSIVDACLDDAILDEVRQDLNEKLDEVCKLAIKYLEQTDVLVDRIITEIERKGIAVNGVVQICKEC